MTAPGPTCPNCGKPLAKATRTVRFRIPRVPTPGEVSFRDFRHPFETVVDVAEYPRSISVAKTLTNLAIVKHRFWPDGTIRHVSTWDAESYQRHYSYFCTTRCAAEFGRSAYKRSSQ